jgi:uncharacterized membrane-anchored protein
MNKLPALTVSFWIMKICATTLGETAGDLLSKTKEKKKVDLISERLAHL